MTRNEAAERVEVRYARDGHTVPDLMDEGFVGVLVSEPGYPDRGVQRKRRYVTALFCRRYDDGVAIDAQDIGPLSATNTEELGRAIARAQSIVRAHGLESHA